MAKARYRLTRTARQDLAEIGRYTKRQWGVAQRRAYLAQLDASLDLLVDTRRWEWPGTTSGTATVAFVKDAT